jgi:hypothetical protein
MYSRPIDKERLFFVHLNEMAGITINLLSEAIRVSFSLFPKA